MGHPPSLCVAGVSLPHIGLALVARLVSVGRPVRPLRYLATCAFVLHGSRGTWSPICFASLALPNAEVALLAHLIPVGRPGCRGALRGRRCAWWHRPLFWRGRRGTCRTSIFVLRGRHGASSHWAGSGGALGPRWSVGRSPWHRGALRGRRGTCRHPPSFCVAGVAPLALCWLWSRATHNIVTHHFVNTTLSHTHNLSHTTHHLSHAALSHTIFHIQLCHTPSLSHTIFHTHTHTKSHTPIHTHTHTLLCHTPSFTCIFVTHHL